MRLLLDTHTLLWLLKGTTELPQNAREVIFDADNEKLLSVGSFWEISIKVGKERLELDRPLPDFLVGVENHPYIRLIPIQTAHWLWLASLPHHHHDPFDRLIVAQALSERCTVVSKDGILDAYGISRLW